MTSITLAFLKFLAIGIATASGIVAALSRTRDRTTDQITRGGVVLVFFMVISATIAAVTQTIEISISNEQQRADRIYRLQEYEALYDLVHPLGELRVQINATYPMSMDPESIGDDWLKRVNDSLASSKRYILLNEPNNVLRPRGDVNGERAVFELLVEPEFEIGINRSTAKAFHDELLFRTGTPQVSNIYVRFDDRALR